MRKPNSIADPYPARAVRPPRAGDPERWYWRCERREAGQRRTLWTGWATRAEAVEALARLAVAPAAPEPTEIRTVRDLLEVWIGASISQRADLSARSQTIYRDAARRLVAEIGEVVLPIDRLTLDGWQNRRIRAGGSAAAVELELRSLRAAHAWAIEVGELVGPPLPRVRIRARPTGVRPTPDPEEIARIVRYLEGRRIAWPARLIRLLAATGARIGEVEDLRWRAIDLGRRILSVAGKTGPREIPLHPSVCAEIRSWGVGAPEDRVWGVSPPRARTGILALLSDAGEALGLPAYSPHAFRRAACDALYRSGGDVAAIAAVLGQSPEVALAHYRTVSPADRARAVEGAALGVLPLLIGGAHSADAQTRKKRGSKP